MEQRLLRLRDGLRLGDAIDAEVSFPGTVLEVARDLRGWTVGGHRLVPGRNLVLSLGAFDVCLEGVAIGAIARPLGDLPDLGLLVATLAVVLWAASWDVAERVAQGNPQVMEEVRAWIAVPQSPPPQRPVRTSPRWTEPVEFTWVEDPGRSGP